MRPYDYPDAFNVIVLDSIASPGVVTITGLSRPKNWDVQKAKGSTGASTVLQGDDPGRFTASFYIVDDEPDPTELNQFDDWTFFRALIESTVNGPKPKALPVYHPDLAEAGFTEVVLGPAGISGPVHDGRGGVTYTVEFLEFLPPKPKPPAKPKAATTSTSGGPADSPKDKYDPNAAAKRELDGLLAEAKKP